MASSTRVTHRALEGPESENVDCGAGSRSAASARQGAPRDGAMEEGVAATAAIPRIIIERLPH